MPYKNLKLQGFRSYESYAVKLKPGVNIVVGPNGSGKTNLLEALYVISTGSSFRASDRDLVKHGAAWFRVEATYGDDERVLTYSLEDTQSPKHFNLDGVKRVRLCTTWVLTVVAVGNNCGRLLATWVFVRWNAM